MARASAPGPLADRLSGWDSLHDPAWEAVRLPHHFDGAGGGSGGEQGGTRTAGLCRRKQRGMAEYLAGYAHAWSDPSGSRA